MSSRPFSSSSARTFPKVAGQERLAHGQRAVLDDHGRQRPLLGVHAGFQDDALGRDLGIGLEFEHVGQEQDHFQQLRDVLLLLGGNRDADASPPHSSTSSPPWSSRLIRSGLASGLSILLMATMIGTPRGLGMIDGFPGLGHHRLVGRDDQDDDVRQLAPRGPGAG